MKNKLTRKHGIFTTKPQNILIFASLLITAATFTARTAMSMFLVLLLLLFLLLFLFFI